MLRVFQFVMLIVIISLMSPPASITAQDSLNPVLQGDIDPNNAKWSSDSTTFTFQENFYHEGLPDFGVISQTASWFTIDVVTMSVIQTNIWPLQPYVSEDQIVKFEIATDKDQLSFIFTSPNRRFIVYAAKRPSDWNINYPMGIADLQTEEHLVIEDIVISSLEEFSWSYDVIWSLTSNSFLILTSGYEQLPIFAKNFDENLNQIELLSLYREGVPVEDENLFAWYAYDISMDGNQVLLADYTGENFRLFLWDASVPENSLMIFENNVLDAVFGPHDNEVLFWNDSGLQIYDVASGKLEILLQADSLNGEPSFVKFSPDASYVAIVTNDLTGPDRLYIVNITTLLR